VGVATARPVPLFTRLRRFLRAKLLASSSSVASLLPLSWALAIGAVGGRLAYVFAGRQRRLAFDHLGIAFPDQSPAERRRIARACFANLGRMALELTQARKIDRQIARYVHWPPGDIEALRKAVHPGEGGLFITGHIGNWELLARRIVAEGFDHLVLGRTPGDPGMASLLERLRAGGGVVTVDRSALSARRQMLTALKRGALVGILIDQDTRVQGSFVPFFGRLAHTPRAAEDLAHRLGMPVFIGFIHRRPEGGHELRTELISPSRGDGLELTARLTERIEAEVRRHPEEWVWMHERWRQQPDGEVTG
jgi:KDO2-lipid IV(A) lauroyltransferase